jgi:hypothetical protein
MSTSFNGKMISLIFLGDNHPLPLFVRFFEVLAISNLTDASHLTSGLPLFSKEISRT